jgi:hypothetical protein
VTCAYFARPVGRETPIKIGYSWNPPSRMVDLRWNGEQCELLAVIERNVEGRLHAHFADWHEGREWFTVNPELLAFIEKAAEFDRVAKEFEALLTALPAPRRLTPNGGNKVAHIGKYAAPVPA